MSAGSMLRTMPDLVLRPVDPDLFGPFGKLVEMGRPAMPVNGGTAWRHDVHEFPASDARGGFRLVTSIYDAAAQDLPRPLGLVERHANSQQLIVPLSGAGHAVVVCLSRPDGSPDPATLAAFRFGPHQGMVYRQGTWHHPILALELPARFLVQSWQDGTASDCEIVSLAPLRIREDGKMLTEERQ